MVLLASADSSQPVSWLFEVLLKNLCWWERELMERLRKILRDIALWAIGIALGLGFIAALGSARLDPIKVIPAVIPAITAGTTGIR